MGSLVLMAVLLGFQSSPGNAGNAAAGMVQIDGATRPELVPQWSVWAYVFRILAGGPRQLPTPVLRLVSRDEEALVLKEAAAAQKSDAACQARLADLLAKRGDASVDALDARLRDITVECRRDTLRARDRVLEALNAEAAAALTAFAESTKAGTSISLPKKNLARFLEPE
ncbi:MAG: hypothetical protein ABI603_02915 [Acidobacteriota bacterium]